MPTATEDGFTVHVDATVDPPPTIDTATAVLAELDALGPAMSVDEDAGRVSVTLSITTRRTVETALNAGLRAVSGALAHAGHRVQLVNSAEVMTFAEHDRQLDEPVVPDLIGTAEVAELLGVSRQRASELRRRPGFPAPVAELASGPVYTAATLQRFIDTWPRRSGRPPASPAR